MYVLSKNSLTRRRGLELVTRLCARFLRKKKYNSNVKKKMDPRDINFQMRSGIGSGQQPVDPNDALTLMAVTSVFMEKAYGDAARYARAMNHPEILGEDIILALKYHALPTSQFLTTTNLTERVGEWRERLVRMMVIEEDEEEEAAYTIQGWWRSVRPSNPPPAVEDETVIQALIEGMHQAALIWPQWQPNDDMGRIVHRAVERAERII